MSAFDVRPIASVPVEPWRNGGGLTRTLARDGDRWRISLAEIERDGPYSRFAGIARTSLILRGNGVTLRDENSVVRLNLFEAVEYDGDAAWHASLAGGPVTALNVMSVRGRYRTRVRAIVDTTVVPPDCTAVVVALDSGCSLREHGSDAAVSVLAGQMLVIEHVARSFVLSPVSPVAATPRRVQLAVLVTIEPAGRAASA